MKKIEAIIRPEKLNDVKVALSDVGVQGMTVTNVLGFGHQKGYTQIYRGQEIVSRLLTKIKIEAVVANDLTDKAVAAIVDASKTGAFGDGKIFISDITDVVRIRTGERGDAAL